MSLPSPLRKDAVLKVSLDIQSRALQSAEAFSPEIPIRPLILTSLIACLVAFCQALDIPEETLLETIRETWEDPKAMRKIL